MKASHYINIIIGLLLSAAVIAQEHTVLQLPFGDQLPSDKVLHIIEDNDGYLWYATEGGGLCRNNGLQIDVFKSDAETPNLLGDNNICCLAEHDEHIIIGTFHGAYVLDKSDFSIKQLPEVDNKRIDDIITDNDNCVWLTANRKIYKYSKTLEYIATYPSRWKGKDVYAARICQDSNGQIWVSQWNGGLLKFSNESKTFNEAAWDLNVAPTAIVSDSINRCLWIGTTGRGIVKYGLDSTDKPQMVSKDNFICIDIQLSADRKRIWATTTDSLLSFSISNGILEKQQVPSNTYNDDMALNRLSIDHKGSLLVANSVGKPFVVIEKGTSRWEEGYILDGLYKWMHHERKGLQVFDASTDTLVKLPYSPGMALPVITKRKEGKGIWSTDGNLLIAYTTEGTDTVVTLNLRPSAMTDDGNGNVWIASNKGLSCANIHKGTIKTVNAKIMDVSALSCDSDGTLWLGTIYGKIFHLENGRLTEDEYASDNYSNAITALTNDSDGNLTIVCDRYIRIYNTKRHTLRQQSRADYNTYTIELTETEPYGKWNNPQSGVIIERMPEWFGSWWMWIIYILCACCLIALLVHYHILKKQRKEFMAELKSTIRKPSEQPQIQENSKKNRIEQEWIEKAITFVEQNLANESYSVEQLSADLCMSRMTFYRKIQSMTGQKPSEFIRSIRLRRAAVMLKEGALTVTEISYATGFSSVSYFSRCFRTMFGVSPTQFGKNTTADGLEPNDTPN